MANNDRNRPGRRDDRYDDRDLDRERWRDDDNRGMFGYEGDGFMHGGARDLDRDIRDRERDEWQRDREYGGRAGYERTASRPRSGPSYGRGAYPGGRTISGGYGSGYSNGYGSDEGYIGGGAMGGDYPGGAWNEAPLRGQNFPAGSPEREMRGDYGQEWQPWRERMERPSYRGRGPKGYHRSDDRIREDVCERLALDDDVDASDIDVTVKDGIVALDGRVTDRGQKRRAEDVVETIRGVRDVDNNLRIDRGEDREMQSKGANEAPGKTVTGNDAMTSNESRAK